MAFVHHSAVTLPTTMASDLLRSSTNGVNGIPLKALSRSRFEVERKNFTVTDKMRKISSPVIHRLKPKMASSSSSKLRSSSPIPTILLSCLNFILFILASASLAPVILLRNPPTSLGWALLLVSCLSLFSSLVSCFSQLTNMCLITHVSLVLASSIGQLLGILALFTREKSSLQLLKSTRDPREALFLIRVECGTLMAMFILQLGVLVMTCAVHSSWVKEYEGWEAEREATARKRSKRMARVQEESMANAVKIAEFRINSVICGIPEGLRQYTMAPDSPSDELATPKPICAVKFVSNCLLLPAFLQTQFSPPPFFRPWNSKPNHLSVVPDLIQILRTSLLSTADVCFRTLSSAAAVNPVFQKFFSLSADFRNFSQVYGRNSRTSDSLSMHKFAAILPGDSVAEIVVTNGILNFLNIYNSILVVRLVLTWFPNSPPAIVSPLSTLCDPYLNIFRGIIPPLGGLDLSPILAFLVLNAFTSTASALPAELPIRQESQNVASSNPRFCNLTTTQKKWMKSPNFLVFSCHGSGSQFQPRSVCVSPAVKSNLTSPQMRKEALSVEIPIASIPLVEPSNPSDLQLDRLQHLDQECINGNGMDFGWFVTRSAVVDEEYWMAAWLRAECHWENKSNERFVDSFKRQFAEQEFNALKRRCKGPYAKKCTCIVAVKKAERNEKQTILKSVVGTLDLTIQYLVQGEEYPGEHKKTPIFNCSKRTRPYIYVANLCVPKSARRRGIASKMLQFAVESAKSDGVEQVFVHVNKDNMSAKELYQKMGFQRVEMATPHSLEQQNYLYCLKT
ncbi:hypothetical protein NE237_027362 [Protea cynaroides]|uniref:N-acetyltransferase domain-containing protein n=1 Tax=Protea cynaroides TaxID=273540 RepID=A0A9Q0GQC7_9MAGN|nr:hypothetical protein NE237_027362 [Protea cynaroides]